MPSSYQWLPVSAGTTDIEVTSGLKEGDEIVTGSYKILRTLRNGASVKVDNTPVKAKTEENRNPVQAALSGEWQEASDPYRMSNARQQRRGEEDGNGIGEPA